jgi:hypothetical protein
MRPTLLFVCFALLSVSACASPPNVRSANDYDAPSAPPVKHPLYDPYAPYGQANATWRPPVINRDGTIVRPADPAEQAQRPDYEHASWATGAAGGKVFAPPGTF